MTALAPTLQAFFTDRLAGQRQASPHTIAAYRDTCRLLLAFAAAAHRQGTLPARLRRPGRPADRRVPRPPRRRPGQQRPDPQRPAGRDPLAVQLRRPAPPRARRASSSGSWPSRQARTDQAIVTYLTAEETDALLAAPDRPPGPAAATTPCSCSPSRPGCGSPSSPA